MIKAVIFDCFGVLTSDGWKQLREEHFADNPEKMQQALDLDKAVNSGTISMRRFISEVGELVGLTEVEVERRLGGNIPDRRLFDFIKHDLKSRCKIGMLSNAGGNWLNDLFEPWQVQLLDSAILSYQVGLVKPEAQIYELAADKLGAYPSECIFVDDIERYCTAASEVGMKTIHHTDTAKTIEQIKEIIRA